MDKAKDKRRYERRRAGNLQPGRRKKRENDIQIPCPNANVIEDIFETERSDASRQADEIRKWLEKIGMK